MQYSLANKLRFKGERQRRVPLPFILQEKRCKFVLETAS